MQISVLVIAIVIFFFPGILWNYIHSSFASNKKQSENSFLVKSLFLGITVYIIEGVFYHIISKFYPVVFYIPALSDKTSSLEINKIINHEVCIEILWSIPIAIICAVINIYFSNYKLIIRILQKIKATRRFGDEDVWEYVFNSKGDEFKWVRIIDTDKKIVITGYVFAFSESEKNRELLLKKVSVFTYEGDELYKANGSYICKPTDSVMIDFPYLPEGDIIEEQDESDEDEPNAQSQHKKWSFQKIFCFLRGVCCKGRN